MCKWFLFFFFVCIKELLKNWIYFTNNKEEESSDLNYPLFIINNIIYLFLLLSFMLNTNPIDLISPLQYNRKRRNSDTTAINDKQSSLLPSSKSTLCFHNKLPPRKVSDSEIILRKSILIIPPRTSSMPLKPALKIDSNPSIVDER